LSFKPDTTIPFQSWVVFEAQSTCKCVCFSLGATVQLVYNITPYITVWSTCVDWTQICWHFHENMTRAT